MADKGRLKRPLLEGALAVATTAIVAGPTPVIADTFLKLGDIQGESTDIKHKGEIDILSFSQSFINTVSIGSATGGAGAGKVQCGAVTMMKNIDASSPFLLKGVATGQHFPDATITFRSAATGKNTTDYYVIKMQDVFVTELSQTDSADPDRIFEKLVLNARSFDFKYTPLTIKGTAGTPVSFKWDCAANKSD